MVFIAGVFVFSAFETRSTPDSDQNDKDVNSLLSCGYIRTNIVNTIFNPEFVLYLSGQQKKYNILNESHIKNAISIWNNMIVDERERIYYQQEHFNKLSLLSEVVDRCDDDVCVIDGEDLAVLRYWISGMVVEVAETSGVQFVSVAELRFLNIENDKNIENALDMITKDPVGQRLVVNAVKQKVAIRAENLHGQKGYFEYASRTIVIDPTVASYVFKINCIVHELVHASNRMHDNSVIEETLAEIIGMAVQDRVTGVEISCNPYVVFIDRLLDPYYGKYPVSNDISEYLHEAGVIINPVSKEDD